MKDKVISDVAAFSVHDEFLNIHEISKNGQVSTYSLKYFYLFEDEDELFEIVSYQDYLAFIIYNSLNVSITGLFKGGENYGVFINKTKGLNLERIEYLFST